MMDFIIQEKQPWTTVCPEPYQAICIVVLLPSKQSSGSAAQIGVQLLRQEERA